MKEFRQIEWDCELESDCRAVLELAFREDLQNIGDLTTSALVPAEATGIADVVARSTGIVAGLSAAALALAAFGDGAAWTAQCADGSKVSHGQVVATMTGRARQLLTAERTVLNLLGRLSGIATLTRSYVAAITGTGAKIYDTRKTTPAWRRLEKYAVSCGGGRNHRLGLCDAVLIKDNHLALGATTEQGKFSPAEAVLRGRAFLASHASSQVRKALVEVEVDTLEQFAEVLEVDPDIILLDNMSTDMLREAVERRNRDKPQIQLEASGGINLSTVRAIAETGVDRISVGALTHSAINFDFGLDWRVS